MASGTKIRIDSDLSSFLNDLDKLKFKGKDAYTSLLESAVRYSDVSKNQLQYVNQIIGAKEREARIGFFDRNAEARQNRTAAFKDLNEQARNMSGTLREKGDFLAEGKRGIKAEYQSEIKASKEVYEEDRLQTSILRQISDAVKQSAREQIIADKASGKSLEERIEELQYSGDPKKQAIAAAIQERVDAERAKEAKQPKERESRDSFLSDMLRFRSINQGLTAVRGLAKTENGFDAMGQITDIASTAGEGIVSTLIKGIGGIFLKGDNPIKRRMLDGLAEGAGRIVGQGLGLAGDIEQRNVNAQNQYLQGAFKLRAMTGKLQGVPDLSRYGYNFDETQAAQLEVAGRFGSGNLNKNTSNVLLMERGLNISRDSLYQLAELQRNTNKDILNTVGGVLGSGAVKDRALLGETLGKFIQLNRTFMESSTRVSDQATMDVLSMFNNVGGEFAVNDFRSLGNIQNINSAISNPGNDAMKAMSYLALRKINPKAGLADLRIMQQMGTSTPGYFSSLLGQLEGMGGGEDFTRLSLEGLGISASAAKTLYNNRQAIYSGKIGQGDLQSILSQSGLEGQAGQNTTMLDQNAADLKNAFVQGSKQGVIELGEVFAKTVTEILGGTTIMLANGQLIPSKLPAANATKRP